MKKILIVSALLIFSAAANAQLFKVFGKEIGFVYAGPKIGGIFSRISNFDEPAFPGADKPDVKFRTGFQFGIVGKFSITPKLSIQPEIAFLQKGLKTEVSGATSKYKTGYIGIPVIAKYALTQFGDIKIHVEGGVFSNVRTSGKYEFTDVTGQTTEGDLNNDGWRRMDYGFVIGGGFEYELDKGIILFDLRYDQSFMDVHISDATFNSNRSIGFSVAYLFDFVDLYKSMKEKKKQKTT
jgi:hypothetical protein